MDVMILMVFVSLVLVGAALVLLVRSVGQGDVDHGDRLSLLPLEADDRPQPTPEGVPTESARS